MTAAALPARTARVDSWTMTTLRAAKAYRDENPATDAKGRAEDAALDAMLERAEAAWAAGHTTVPNTEPYTAGQTTSTRSPIVAAVNGNRNAPTEAQLRYLAKLAEQLGTELQTPRDKSHASLIIDGAKKQLAAKPAAARTERLATDRQQEFLASLLCERMHQLGEPDVTTMSAARASELIERLMAAPRAAVAEHGIREGYYAHSTDGGATADHYRVTRTGRIKVWTASGEFPYRGKLNVALEWIKANQREAAALFGQLVGTCGRCGRALSDDASRAQGLGPVCAGKDW